jgi:hypothetical protein
MADAHGPTPGCRWVREPVAVGGDFSLGRELVQASAFAEEADQAASLAAIGATVVGVVVASHLMRVVEPQVATRRGPQDTAGTIRRDG